MPAATPEPQDASDDSAAGALPVAAVARRLGVAPATLRTWDRRYGLGPSTHSAGAHRRYAPRDVARLETMRRLTLEGVPPADAARAALSPALSAGLSTSPAAPPATRPAALVPAPRPRDRPGGPGGRVLALPGASATVVGLGRAAMALDSVAVLDTVRRQLREHGVVHTWEHVLRPVLAAAGSRWASTGEGIEVEHLLSECVTVALREAGALRHAEEPRPVLLASAPDDQHALPLHAVAAGLAERGVGSRVLGSSLPADALQAAVRRTGPGALFLWSQLPGTGDPAVLLGLPTTRPPTALVVGGPGWPRAGLPPRVALATDLADAVHLVAAAVGR